MNTNTIYHHRWGWQHELPVFPMLPQQEASNAINMIIIAICTETSPFHRLCERSNIGRGKVFRIFPPCRTGCCSNLTSVAGNPTLIGGKEQRAAELWSCFRSLRPSSSAGCVCKRDTRLSLWIASFIFPLFYRFMTKPWSIIICWERYIVRLSQWIWWKCFLIGCCPLLVAFYLGFYLEWRARGCSFPLKRPSQLAAAENKRQGGSRRSLELH